MNNADAARMFKAFSDERRLEILEKLQTGEKCASELLEEMYMGQSTLSHHMKILCESGVVTTRKTGTFVYYSISDAGSNQVKDVLEALTKIKGYRMDGRK
jgi:ArsR family transcriptional regulator